MKKSNSIHKRSQIKSPKLQLNTNKPLLPHIPSSLSPELKSNLKPSSELTQSPLLNRAAKSQVQFAFIKQEENKSKQSDRKPSLALAQISEKDFHPERDFSEKLKTVKENLRGANRLEKGFPQYNAEEPASNKIKSKKMIDSSENDFIIEESLEDEIKSLNGIIMEQTKAYSKLEELYFEDTNCLKRENEKLKQNNKKIEEENNSLKIRLDIISRNCEEGDRNNNDKMTEIASKLEYCQNNLKEKNSELFQLSEVIRKLQLEKKNREENFKELQKQCSFLSDSNRKLEQDLAFQKREVKLTSDNLYLEREKIKILELQMSDYVLIKEKYGCLEDNLKDYQKSADLTSVSYNELKSQYNALQDLYKETEEQLKTAQDKIFESKFNTLGNRNSILRRNSTLTYPVFESLDKDNANKLSLKITELEEQLQSEKFEKEKLKKDFEYCKKIADEKTEIILKINKKIESDVAGQLHSFKSGYFKKITEIGRRVEWLVDLVKEKFKCELCNSYQNARYIGMACQHLFCKNCAMIKDSCSSCTKSKLIKVKQLKSVSISYTKISESVSELFLLINSNNN